MLLEGDLRLKRVEPYIQRVRLEHADAKLRRKRCPRRRRSCLDQEDRDNISLTVAKKMRVFEYLTSSESNLLLTRGEPALDLHDVPAAIVLECEIEHRIARAR